jgi:mannosyl-3-phosphoglycerate phosphatase
MEKVIIFSDLDGTLLDHNSYSYEPAKPALQLIASNEIPLILTSSKTLAEIVEIQLELEINHPFIVENGGAICIPPGYFERPSKRTVIGNYETDLLGPPYPDILKYLSELKQQTGFRFKGFNEMSLEEIMTLTELPGHKAALAKDRLCSEPLVWNDTPQNFEAFTDFLKQRGLKLLKGGRFYHLMGDTDKGKAVSYLTDLFKTEYPRYRVRTIGVGDSPNDAEMLSRVNIPVLVQRPDGTYIDIPATKEIIYADGPGPVGWNKAVMEILTKRITNDY